MKSLTTRTFLETGAKVFSGGTVPDELALMLNKKYMSSLLSNRLFGGATITDCQIQYTRYKTYRKPASTRKAFLSVSYLLDFDCNKAPAIVLAKGYLDGRGNTVYTSLLELQRHQVHYLADHDMLLWRFPSDPAMPWLSRLMNSETVLDLLPWQQLESADAAPSGKLEAQAEVVHYRPEQRCMIRYRLNDGNGYVCGPEIYGKTFVDDQARIISQRIMHHWQAGCEKRDRFLVGRPLGWLPQFNLIWQQGLSVTPMTEALQNSDPLPLLERIAIALTGFHRDTGAECELLAPEHHITETAKKLDKLERAFPEYRQRLSTLAEQIAGDARRAVAPENCLIHNDLHLRQLGVADNRIALFDFDEFHCGDPTQDLADFVVDLLQIDGERADNIKLARSFLSAYAHHVDWRIDVANLNWHIRNKLIAKTYRAHTQQLPALQETVAELLDLAHTVEQYDLLVESKQTTGARS
ncbi:MAG: aminoglycoside phosphotransferase family protein [Burkholderiales bacterium]|nr:aminoglycoside phosphotransferase family protein [Nitrosomonas sp.]MCP5273419.1 aminoglycoside phosphotransferase family protein [Burkholderiales bacterium]